MHHYTYQLGDLIQDRLRERSTRLYGFEYEFMPAKVLDPSDLDSVVHLLPRMGYQREPTLLRHRNHYVTFEPGGQIEYCSPPVRPDDRETVPAMLDHIDAVNLQIHERLGIQYLAVGYIPGRQDAPMLLNKDRYWNLHHLLAQTGSRGHEMMKGTAAIHLHTSILSLEELPRLWRLVCQCSLMEEFAMGMDRRDIWNQTDDSRCGLLCGKLPEQENDPLRFLDHLVNFGLGARELATGRPFRTLEGQSFETFLSHASTLFTDVRFNLKGITLELRTPDSCPRPQFWERWRRFVEIVEEGINDR